MALNISYALNVESSPVCITHFLLFYQMYAKKLLASTLYTLYYTI